MFYKGNINSLQWGFLSYYEMYKIFSLQRPEMHNTNTDKLPMQSLRSCLEYCKDFLALILRLFKKSPCVMFWFLMSCINTAAAWKQDQVKKKEKINPYSSPIRASPTSTSHKSTSGWTQMSRCVWLVTSLWETLQPNQHRRTLRTP